MPPRWASCCQCRPREWTSPRPPPTTSRPVRGGAAAGRGGLVGAEQPTRLPDISAECPPVSATLSGCRWPTLCGLPSARRSPTKRRGQGGRLAPERCGPRCNLVGTAANSGNETQARHVLHLHLHLRRQVRAQVPGSADPHPPAGGGVFFPPHLRGLPRNLGSLPGSASALRPRPAALAPPKRPAPLHPARAKRCAVPGTLR